MNLRTPTHNRKSTNTRACHHPTPHQTTPNIFAARGRWCVDWLCSGPGIDRNTSGWRPVTGPGTEERPPHSHAKHRDRSPGTAHPTPSTGTAHPGTEDRAPTQTIPHPGAPLVGRVVRAAPSAVAHRLRPQHGTLRRSDRRHPVPGVAAIIVVRLR